VVIYWINYLPGTLMKRTYRDKIKELVKPETLHGVLCILSNRGADFDSFDTSFYSIDEIIYDQIGYLICISLK